MYQKELVCANLMCFDLEKDGWYSARTRGSHRQFKHQSKSGTVTVSGKPSVDVPPGTMNSILKQAGLK
jgi:predicted RNA binding protein YcfA (HicA-like mRNA interferase family)